MHKIFTGAALACLLAAGPAAADAKLTPGVTEVPLPTKPAAKPAKPTVEELQAQVADLDHKILILNVMVGQYHDAMMKVQEDDVQTHAELAALQQEQAGAQTPAK